MMERTETMKVMDRLEELVLKRGWPVPFSNYYLVNHEKMLGLLDTLRASLQDEMDERFIKAFACAESAQATLLEEKIAVNERPVAEKLSQKLMKKESSH